MDSGLIGWSTVVVGSCEGGRVGVWTMGVSVFTAGTSVTLGARAEGSLLGKEFSADFERRMVSVDLGDSG